MVAKRRRVDHAAIIPVELTVLKRLCADLSSWPELWKLEPADIAIGERIVEIVQPFLLDLLYHGLADKTLARHRDHIEMLGGEIIRRHHDHACPAKRSVRELMLDLIDPEGGPLIWPRITESAQDAFDTTCRKLYRFLRQQDARK
jgi:hypothetical protein